ncbi:tRNA-dihydrouridine synthase family protein [Candidatus Kaiserbacteria bacterium]|nr:tRNA-dihydrouridine synthase family protein [Candidatus Kaiserbacteria bacterium]
MKWGIWYRARMQNFWEKLPKPFFALAPLEDVTDAAFRRLIAKYSKYGGRDVGDESKESLPAEAFRVGGPDVMFTEFTSADGLVLAHEEGQRKLRKKLIYSESERPIVAQIFGSVPENIERASALVAELGFDGVDVNMGCPDRAVEKGGCGAALIKSPALARKLIRAAAKSGLPVSVKTRIGYNKDELETWLPELLAENLAAITLHARTRKEMSDVPAHWDRIKHAVEIRNKWQGKTLPQTLIIGNGDVEDLNDARAKAEETKCDGVMLGRAIFGNPWLFSNSRELEHSPEDRIQALLEHLALFDELLSDTTSYTVMKKHFKAYISGWNGAKELRVRMMATNNVGEATSILQDGIVSA